MIEPYNLNNDTNNLSIIMGNMAKNTFFYHNFFGNFNNN